MECTVDGRVLVVADTCVLINFMRVGRLDLVCRHRGFRLVVTEHVRAEILDPVQADLLATAISLGNIEEVMVTDPAELALFATLNAVLGHGESAAIAVAALRGWHIATDEKGRTRREVETRLGRGRLLTTPDLLLSCIRSGSLTLSEADAIKDALAASRFVMNFNSFGDLMP